MTNTQTSLRMFSVAHKPVDFVPEGYSLLQVGAANKPHFSDLTDDTGDNISALNESFCEVTALYWIWKNVDAKRLGITHYRRYFMENSFTTNPRHILTVDALNEALDEYDLIAPEQYWFKSTSREAYAKAHHVKDLDYVETILAEYSPEAIPSFKRTLNRKTLSLCNMIATRREIFEDYMSWLMPILMEAYGSIDTTDYSAYDKRLVGYLAEWLYNVWLDMHPSLNVLYAPVAQIDRTGGNAVVRSAAKAMTYPLKKMIIRKDLKRD